MHDQWGGDHRQDCYRVVLLDIAQDNLGHRKKIHAIKSIRAVSGMGLKEAKDVIDQWHPDHPSQIYYCGTPALAESIKAKLEDDDESGVLTLEVWEPMWIDDQPDGPTIQLAIYLARDFPIKPEEIRKISDILNETTDPVTALRKAAAMIEVA